MNYFTALSLVLGSAMVCSRPILDLLVRGREGNVPSATQPHPKWTVPMSFLSVGMVGATWYQFMANDVPYSILITVIVTLAMYKVTKALLDYPRFRYYVVKVLDPDSKRRERMTERTMIAGALIIMLGLFLY